MSTRHRHRGTLAILALTLLAPAASVAKEVTYQYYRFTPVLLRGAANSVQLAEFEFLNAGTPLDLTGVFVTNPGGDNPPAGPPDPPVGGAENPEKVIDLDTDTKWLDFMQTMPLVFDFPAPVTIDAYNFATANDGPERDPISWTFEGSDDGFTWTLLDAVNNYPTTTARFTYEAGFAIPETTPPVIVDFEALPAVVLNGTTIDLAWTSTNGTTAEIDPAVGSVPTNGTQAVIPPDGADTTYTLTVTNAVDTVSAEALVRTVAGGISTYQYFRFTPVKMRGNGGENSIQLAEFEFLNAGTPLDLTGVIVTNPGGDNPPAGPPDPPVGGAENPESVIDGDINTKWLDFNKAALEFDFGAPVAIDSYRFITANDSPDRDPVQWVMEGSDDGTSWELIENMTAFDYPVPTARFTATEDIPLPGASLRPYVTISFYADQPTAIAGEEINLYWDVTGFFDKVEIDNGIGEVAEFGETAVTPAASTTYTISVSLAGGAPATMELPVTIVTPAITDICYADFDAAGEELQLLGSAGIINDFPNISLPGDVSRLRLNGDLGNQSGTAWFRRRVDFSQGFDASFDLQFVTTGIAPNTGADGISFIIQNNATGTGTAPAGMHEDGLPLDALNIKFDSYLNAGDLSAAVIQVRDGTFIMAEADLSTNPAITLGGTDPLDMSQDDPDAAPYRVRVTYVPGDLNVFFNGVLVIANVDIDLADAFAVDGSGKGFVGFSARTGGSFEAHDITSWCLTEGPPAPAIPIDILSSSFDFDTDTVTLTFTSADTRSYRVTSSTDGINFSNVLATGIAGAAGATETGTTVSFTQVPFLLLRVEQE